MKKFTINGIEFNNFGPNNYSKGMELITTTRSQMNIPMASLIERVLQGKFHGVYLNPSAPCNIEEFFGVFGTEEQYEKFYREQKDCQVAQILIEKLGGMESLMAAPMDVYSKAREEAYNEYKDWWDE